MPPKRFLFTSILALILTLACVSQIFTGCKNPPRTHQAVVFDTFRTTYRGALQAYESWNELVIKGKVSEENRLKGDKAWNDFRAAFTLAMRTATGGMDATSTPQAQALANEFIALIRRL